MRSEGHSWSDLTQMAQDRDALKMLLFVAYTLIVVKGNDDDDGTYLALRR